MENFSKGKNIAKFLLYSMVGIFMFFIPIKINNKSTIPIDHIVTFIRNICPVGCNIYAIIVIIAGGIYPFLKKTWNKNKITMIFSILKVLGVIVGIMAFLNIGPSWMFEKDMVPFLFNKLVISVGVIVPIGSVFLAFLVGYGFMEFVGVFMQPVMKPIWKTPGRSAIDAVASFVGSYSIALLITNRVYKEGRYTAKEACIIATGFSTVSATFMIIIADTLGIMNLWNQYFWITLIVTFIVTAITARIKPLRTKPNKYYDDIGKSDKIEIKGSRINIAWDQAMKTAENAPTISENVKDNLKDGLLMAMGILPSILSVGLLGLILAKYTPVFNVLGYIFYPVTLICKVPEPLLAAKACSVEIAEMFLPALLVVNSPLITKFIVAIVSVSAILFFSASIPCILSTDIPIDIKDIIVIWFERVVFTIILTTPIAYFLL